MKKPLRIKRFEVVPLEYEVETTAPLLAKLRVYCTFWRYVRLCKIQPTLGEKPLCEKPLCRPFWRLFYARIKWVRV